MPLVTAAHRRLRENQNGFTLVELLVVMIILGVLGAMTLTVVTTTFDSASVTSDRVRSLNELELAMQRVVRDLRVAEQLVLDPNDDFSTSIGARINRDGVESIVRYLVETTPDGEQQLIRADSGFTLVALLDNVDGVGDEIPVFRYLDRLGREIDCSSDAECAARYMDAAQIELSFVRDIPNREPVRAETRVNVRSIRYGGS